MSTKLKENHGVNIIEPCKRNFLKENMENITKLKRQRQQNDKTKNRNGLVRLQAGGKPKFLWRKRDFNEVQCQCDPFYLADHDTQTYRIEDETSMEGAKVIFPSQEILKAIREERERKFQENLSEKLREKRKFEKTEDEVYLDSLSEYLDTGAISRRKKLIAEECLEMDKKLNDLEFDAKMILELAKKRTKLEQPKEITVQDEGDVTIRSEVKMYQNDEIDKKETLIGKKIENAINEVQLKYDNENLVADKVTATKTQNEVKSDEIVVLFKRSDK